jgi:hypothetical protein
MTGTKTYGNKKKITKGNERRKTRLVTYRTQYKKSRRKSALYSLKSGPEKKTTN